MWPGTGMTFRRFWKGCDVWLMNWLKWYSNVPITSSSLVEFIVVTKVDYKLLSRGLPHPCFVYQVQKCGRGGKVNRCKSQDHENLNSIVFLHVPSETYHEHRQKRLWDEENLNSALFAHVPSETHSWGGGKSWDPNFAGADFCLHPINPLLK